ncbi:MAG: pyrroline-5-carboxylate reductase [Spirulinaceae cyanobacterium SM2_1_0]|nr:pyrroline-5-carboxylate reductase [Spirulinaceae cyanobacterium SM2_1_0]
MTVQVIIQLSVIGGGVMGEALLSRLLARQLYPANAVLVCDPSLPRRQFLQATYGVQVSADNQNALAASEAILLAVKPQALVQVAAGLKHEGSTLLLSILAGVPLAKLQAVFPGRPVVRAMPNTPATVGAGMTAIAPSAEVSELQRERAEAIFAAVGEVVTVPESLLDAVTGLSGSGPAYIALLIEALADGGVAAGLPRAIALQLALQTVSGTAQLLQDTGWHPAELKDRVTSPGGTTIAGVAALEQHGFRSAAIEAVKAASERSRQLGQG